MTTYETSTPIDRKTRTSQLPSIDVPGENARSISGITGMAYIATRSGTSLSSLPDATLRYLPIRAL